MFFDLIFIFLNSLLIFFLIPNPIFQILCATARNPHPRPAPPATSTRNSHARADPPPAWDIRQRNHSNEEERVRQLSTLCWGKHVSVSIFTCCHQLVDDNRVSNIPWALTCLLVFLSFDVICFFSSWYGNMLLHIVSYYFSIFRHALAHTAFYFPFHFHCSFSSPLSTSSPLLFSHLLFSLCFFSPVLFSSLALLFPSPPHSIASPSYLIFWIRFVVTRRRLRVP